MNKLDLIGKLPEGMAKGVEKFGLFWARNGGTVLNVSGTLSMMAATYFGVQAGRKIDAVVDNARLLIKEAEKTGDQKLIKSVKIRCAKDICMVLGLPIGLSIGGALLIGRGTIKQREQVAGLAAAYAGVLAEYKDLKRRAAESIVEVAKFKDDAGEPYSKEEASKMIEDRLDAGGKLVESGNCDEANNKELIFQYDLNSPYEFLFDCRSQHFNKHDPFKNLTMLKNFCRIVNYKYQAGHPVFMSEILDELDIPKTKASLVNGWYIKSPTTDGHISFGIEPFVDGTADFKDWEFLKDGIPLRFNCDGPIAYLLAEKDWDA